MRVSVVIPTFNRRKIVRRTLESLFAQTFPSDEFEIIVVVDGSTDGTAESLSFQPPCAFHIIEQPNRGPAAARNAGAFAARGELVIFVDDDMICDHDLIAAHVALHRDGASRIGVGALFLSPDSPRTPASDCFEREIGAFHLRAGEQSSSNVALSSWVVSNTSIPTTVFLESGGFDESFRKREDFELLYRLVSRGTELRYVPAAIARQLYTKSAADLLRDAAGFAAGDIQMINKHPDYWSRSPLRQISADSRWQQSAKTAMARIPVLPDAALGFCWWSAGVLGRLAAPLRRAGAKALSMHRGIVWQRQVTKSLNARS